MKEKNHLSLLSNYKSQNKKLWIALLGLLLITVLISMRLVTLKTDEKTIVVPANFNKPFTVQGDQYDNSYKEQMTVYLTQLLLNYQPNNVRYQFSEFLQYVHPSKSEALRAKLNIETKNILSKSASSVFYPTNVKVEGNDVTVQGNLVGMVGKSVVKNERKAYKIVYNTKNGFYIDSVVELVAVGSGFKEVEQKVEDILD